MCLNTSYFFIFLLTNNNTNLTVNKQSTQQVKCIMYVISATTLRSYGSRALKLHHVFSSSQMLLCDCVVRAEAILILNIVFSSVLDHVCRQLAVTSEFSLLQFCQLAPLATYCVLSKDCAHLCMVIYMVIVDNYWQW